MEMIDQILNLIEDHKFEHFFLIKNIDRAIESQSKINSKWLIGKKGSWILGFCSNNHYNIYGLNYTLQLLDQLIEELDLNILPNNIYFSGDKHILKYIFSNKPEFEFEIFKDRYFYQIIKKDFNPFTKNIIRTRFGELKDLEILSHYFCLYFEEEYKGENNKSLDESFIKTNESISNNQILVAEIDEKVVGYCTIMNSGLNNEMIGTVFVYSEYRNKGIGRLLVSEMTNIVISRNPKCWLMTETSNFSINKIVESLGYSILFEYLSGMCKKNCS